MKKGLLKIVGVFAMLVAVGLFLPKTIVKAETTPNPTSSAIVEDNPSSNIASTGDVVDSSSSGSILEDAENEDTDNILDNVPETPPLETEDGKSIVAEWFDSNIVGSIFTLAGASIGVLLAILTTISKIKKTSNAVVSLFNKAKDDYEASDKSLDAAKTIMENGLEELKTTTRENLIGIEKSVGAIHKEVENVLNNNKELIAEINKYKAELAEQKKDTAKIKEMLKLIGVNDEKMIATGVAEMIMKLFDKGE